MLCIEKLDQQAAQSIKLEFHKKNTATPSSAVSTRNILTGLVGGCSCNFSALALQSETTGGVCLFVSAAVGSVMVFGSQVATHRYSNIDQYFTFDLLTTSQLQFTCFSQVFSFLF